MSETEIYFSKGPFFQVLQIGPKKQIDINGVKK